MIAPSGSSEYRKMLAGEPYLASDPQLVAARGRARDLTRAYNQSRQDEQALRNRLLCDLLGEVGTNTWIEPPFHCDYGRHIFIADNVYLNFNCVMLDCAPIRLGRNVKVGPSVQFYAAHHPIDAEHRIAGPEMASPITIDENVWIGGGTIICPGVRIGPNAVIGAGSVVAKDIPADVVAVGNPCRVIRAIG